MEKEVEILSAALNTVTVKALVSFFLSGSGGSVSSQAIHKEKFKRRFQLISTGGPQ